MWDVLRLFESLSYPSVVCKPERGVCIMYSVNLRPCLTSLDREGYATEVQDLYKRDLEIMTQKFDGANTTISNLEVGVETPSPEKY